MAVVATGTFPVHVDLNDIEHRAMAKPTANIFHKPVNAETQPPRELFWNHRHDYFTDTQIHERSHSRIPRRQLAECTLASTCRGKAFKDCNFNGCLGLRNLNLQKRKLTGPIPVGLAKWLKNLQYLCVEGDCCMNQMERLSSLTECIRRIRVGLGYKTGALRTQTFVYPAHKPHAGIFRVTS